MIRHQWDIENKLQWSLDVPCNANRCRIRKDSAPAHRAAVRPSALHLWRQEHTPQMRLRQQRLLCGLDEPSMLTVLCRVMSEAITPPASPVRRVRSPWECSRDTRVLATTALVPLSCAPRPAASLVTTHRGHALPTSSSPWSPHLCMGAGIPHASEEHTPCPLRPLARGGACHRRHCCSSRGIGGRRAPGVRTMRASPDQTPLAVRAAERCHRRLPAAPGYVFFGDQSYAFAHAPPISRARSASLRRSVVRKGSTACA